MSPRGRPLSRLTVPLLPGPLLMRFRGRVRRIAPTLPCFCLLLQKNAPARSWGKRCSCKQRERAGRPVARTFGTETVEIFGPEISWPWRATPGFAAPVLACHPDAVWPLHCPARPESAQCPRRKKRPGKTGPAERQPPGTHSSGTLRIAAQICRTINTLAPRRPLPLAERGTRPGHP